MCMYVRRTHHLNLHRNDWTYARSVTAINRSEQKWHNQKALNYYKIETTTAQENNFTSSSSSSSNTYCTLKHECTLGTAHISNIFPICLWRLYIPTLYAENTLMCCNNRWRLLSSSTEIRITTICLDKLTQ